MSYITVARCYANVASHVDVPLVSNPGSKKETVPGLCLEKPSSLALVTGPGIIFKNRLGVAE